MPSKQDGGALSSTGDYSGVIREFLRHRHVVFGTKWYS
jgi:hypothetical protein